MRVWVRVGVSEGVGEGVGMGMGEGEGEGEGKGKGEGEGGGGGVFSVCIDEPPSGHSEKQPSSDWVDVRVRARVMDRV